MLSIPSYGIWWIDTPRFYTNVGLFCIFFFLHTATRQASHFRDSSWIVPCCLRSDWSSVQLLTGQHVDIEGIYKTDIYEWKPSWWSLLKILFLTQTFVFSAEKHSVFSFDEVLTNSGQVILWYHLVFSFPWLKALFPDIKILSLPL